MFRISPALAAFVLLLPLSVWGQEPAANGLLDRPDVLFIAVDDMNDWIEPLGGHPDARTPNLNRLAKMGTTFTQAHCAAPACNPSRAAIMTGVRPSTSGVYHNDQPWRPAMPDAVTLPQLFTKHGYKVVGGGKIFHNAYNDLESWQEWQKAGSFPVPSKVPYSGIPNAAHFDWGPVDAADEQMGDHSTVDWAIKHLQSERKESLFLACGLIRPHLPFYAPQKYFDLFPIDKIAIPKVLDTDLDDVPAAGKAIAKPDGDHRKVIQAGQHRAAVQAYLASIAYADYEIGRLLDALEKSPRAKNTIVVLWGDHGWHLGEKLHWRKFSLWEESTRSPLFVMVPGMTEAGSRCERPVSLMDLAPTLAELCQLKQLDAWESTSIVPLLKDAKTEWTTPALCTHGKGNHSLRSEQYRYIVYADGSEELYDHAADPNEWKNLAADPKLAGVKEEFRKHLPKVNAADASTSKPQAAGGKKAAGKKGKKQRPADTQN